MTPDPGWNYNPGKAGFDVILSKYDPDIVNQFLKELEEPNAKRLFMFTQFKYGNSQNIPDRFQNEIGNRALPDQFFNKLRNKIPFRITRQTQNSWYNPRTNKIQIGIGRPRNYDEPTLSWYKKYVAIHEYSHAYHHHTGEITNNYVSPRIKKAFDRAKTLFDKLPPQTKEKFKRENFDRVFREMKNFFKSRYTDEQIKEMTLSAFDVVQALTNEKFGCGHEKNYYRTTPLTRYKEFFTHSAEAFFKENPVLKLLLPDIHKEMLKIWTEMEGFI